MLAISLLVSLFEIQWPILSYRVFFHLPPPYYSFLRRLPPLQVLGKKAQKHEL